MDRKKLVIVLFFVFVSALFIYIRIKPLHFQTVAYTYDQGRDFLKAAEMVMTRKPTFIGPTTGINGLYHGAWWYYVLAIPFILFKGSPIGFYYFNLAIQFGAFFVLFYFAKKYFGSLSAGIVSLLVALSPYFIYVSVFVGNNTMVPPILLGFLILNFMLLENKKINRPFMFAIGLGFLLGLVAEFELSFGLFLIPTYFIAQFLFKKLRTFYGSFHNLGFFLLGLGIAFIPRILFEIKNKFIQTATFFSFLFKPKLFNPKSYIETFRDRLELFRWFYEGIFPHSFFTIIFGVLITLFLIYLLVKRTGVYSRAQLFLFYLFGMLFFLSTLYKDFFWGNYFEGIQYILILLISIVFSTRISRYRLERYGKSFIIFLLLFFGLWQVVSSWKSTPRYEGLAVHRAVVSYIISHEKNINNYCVRIYTPPVFPHTYNYVFLYEKLKRDTPLPGTDWVNGTCWFIMEPDPFRYRLKEWKKIHEPEKKATITSKKIHDVLINHYEVIQ